MCQHIEKIRRSLQLPARIDIHWQKISYRTKRRILAICGLNAHYDKPAIECFCYDGFSKMPSFARNKIECFFNSEFTKLAKFHAALNPSVAEELKKLEAAS